MNGLDLMGLGSKSWNITDTIKYLAKGMAIGCFDTTFGPNTIANLIKLLNTGKVPAVRVHIWWDVTRKYRIVPMDTLVKRLPKYQELAMKYPNVRFYISHSCEYHEDNAAEVKKRVDAVIRLAPKCTPVQTPLTGSGSPTVAGFIVEKHGLDVKATAGQIASYDGGKKGEGLFDVNARAWIAANTKAEITFAWGPKFNLAEEVKDGEKLPPPNKRVAAPPGAYVMSLARLFDSLGDVPTPKFPAGSISPVAKPLLWKTHAEDMEGVQARDNKPLIILRKKTDTVDCVTFNGKLIAKLKYFAPYTGGLFRFYSGLPGGAGIYGWQIADKAKTNSGSPWIWIKQGTKYFGPIHPTFRIGYFQQTFKTSDDDEGATL